MEAIGRSLDRLDEQPVRRRPAHGKAGPDQPLPVLVVVLETMSVALRNLRRSVCPLEKRARKDLARVGSEPHRPALPENLQLLLHEVNDTVLSVFCKFPAVRIRDPQHISCIFDNRDLHSETNAEIRDVPLSRIPAGEDHSFDPAVPESSRHQDPVRTREFLFDRILCQTLRIDPEYFNFGSVFIPSVIESLADGEI